MINCVHHQCERLTVATALYRARKSKRDRETDKSEWISLRRAYYSHSCETVRCKAARESRGVNKAGQIGFEGNSWKSWPKNLLSEDKRAVRDECTVHTREETRKRQAGVTRVVKCAAEKRLRDVAYSWVLLQVALKRRQRLGEGGRHIQGGRDRDREREAGKGKQCSYKWAVFIATEVSFVKCKM